MNIFSQFCVQQPAINHGRSVYSRGSSDRPGPSAAQEPTVRLSPHTASCGSLVMLRTQPSCREEASAACREATGRKTTSPAIGPQELQLTPSTKCQPCKGTTLGWRDLPSTWSKDKPPHGTQAKCRFMLNTANSQAPVKAWADPSSSSDDQNLAPGGLEQPGPTLHGPLAPGPAASLLFLVPTMFTSNTNSGGLAISSHQAQHPPLRELWDLCPQQLTVGTQHLSWGLSTALFLDLWHSSYLKVHSP